MQANREHAPRTLSHRKRAQTLSKTRTPAQITVRAAPLPRKRATAKIRGFSQLPYTLCIVAGASREDTFLLIFQNPNRSQAMAAESIEIIVVPENTHSLLTSTPSVVTIGEGKSATEKAQADSLRQNLGRAFAPAVSSPSGDKIAAEKAVAEKAAIDKAAAEMAAAAKAEGDRVVAARAVATRAAAEKAAAEKA
ncbi:hypothetical protein L596_014796 [Steinernema carpocapsae]|uniref:Uncharacterized protein n=1 Tax=Steinernema carpocapsae TaxID=34508 RepID=A0A4U5NCX8_STECR|nr:hypothetical protein L596_014796 [Steinernema carpocapsae]